MEYREMVNQLLTEKMKDPRFAFPSYIVSACERVKDGILDTHYHQIHAGEPLKKQSDYFFKGIPIGRLRDAMN